MMAYVLRLNRDAFKHKARLDRDQTQKDFGFSSEAHCSISFTKTRHRKISGLVARLLLQHIFYRMRLNEALRRDPPKILDARKT